jgi:hypothetical protein
VVLETLPLLAVKVTDCEEVNEETVAVNPALVAPDETVTDVGTETVELLLDRFTMYPPLRAAALIVTVQLSVPAPVMVPLAQLSPVRVGDDEEPVAYVYETTDHFPETCQPKST